MRLSRLRIKVHEQIYVEGHFVDFLIGRRLILQIDGGYHVGKKRRDDIAFDADLTLRGYYVIRVDYVQVMNEWPSVYDRILRAIAEGLHR